MEVRRYAGLEALPDAYGPLLQAAEAESFFNGGLWYRALLATTTMPGDDPRFYGLEDGGSGRPLGLLPAISAPRSRGPLGARLLSGCHSVYSMAFSPLLSPDLQDRGAAVEALIGALQADRPRWDVISLRLLDRDSEVFAQLLAAFERSGLTPEPYFQFGNWYEEIAGRSFAQYLADRGKSIRKTAARAVRHFDDRSDGHYAICSGGDGLEEAIADFKKVYGASWKSGEQHPAFIERLLRDCAAGGFLRLANLYLDGRPVATWFVIVANGTAVLMKTAYDGDVPASLSVGGVLTFKVIQHLIDVDGVELIDFGVGDEEYKSKWMSSRRERWGIMAYNRQTAKGRVLATMMQGRTWVRGTLRRGAAE
jgi:CelD/BcsL family acetyltransferase involved in cellulose biosynthesis